MANQKLPVNLYSTGGISDTLKARTQNDSYNQFLINLSPPLAFKEVVCS